MHSCYLLEHREGRLLLECGPSVLAGMKRGGLDSASPDAILVSHLHGDHFGGIPFMFLEYLFNNPRTRPLSVAGPPTLRERTAGLYGQLYREDHCRDISFPLDFVEVHPGTQLGLAGFEIDAFEVPHSAEPFSLGYRLTAPDGEVVVFSGDSAWTDEFVTRTADSDLFLCECCSMQADTPVHVSYDDILAHHAELGCQRLMLTHLGEDVRAADGLRVERARDGITIDIG